MTTDTTPHAQAVPVYEPFNQPGRTFRPASVWEADITDWALARIALDRRSSAAYTADPLAEEARLLGEEFTAEEAHRVDAFLAAGVQDVHRLDAITAASDLAGEDRAWLIDQLRLAWQRLDRLHDSIDTSGSLMNATHAASSVDYVRWSRKPQALSPLNRPGRPNAAR
ncbi:hypothetical protein ADK60_08655 [Streptomyces sp. XY431]|uniref:hypothetical protein n=1 Tax=Streptomyces sp. XY431 TaxID=1415562 RepID=UPI0006AE22F4|nr:hypothetical protein [Streptomyces sp. XY431]KOV35762.1 hypothetical protein ADK60_08655 [Streptomyces sp. XY431]